MFRHAYNKRLEDAPPKLPKCPSIVKPKLASFAVVQEGACLCLGQSISHLYHSLQCLRIIRRGMLRTMMSVMVLRLRIVTPSHWKWPAFNAAVALHLVRRRRLGRSARLRLLFKDGAIYSVMTILRTIFATNNLVNGLYTRLSNSLLNTLHSLMTFWLCSRTHAWVMQAKHILFIKQFQHW